GAEKRLSAGAPRQASGRTSRLAKPSAPALDAELARVVTALEEGVARRDLSAFYQAFRATHLPSIVEHYIQDPRGLARACFKILHRIGSVSPAVGVAIENHYYVLTTLATLPIRDNPELAARRQSLLQRVIQERLLVANTSFRVHEDKVAAFGAQARRDGEGYRVNGAGAFLSLAGEGDLLFFAVPIDGTEPAYFITPLRDNPGIEIGPLVFPQAMVDSDTRRIAMHDHYLTAGDLLLKGKSEATSRLTSLQFAWHQVLVPALFLGAAARAIEEARKFLRAVKAPNGQPLAELDGTLTDVGRLVIRYRAACGITHQAGERLEALARRDPKPAEIADAVDLACAAKRTAAQAAEEIVAEARRIIGPRVFTGGHPLERISAEVVFAPLVGEPLAVIDRRYGRLVLGETDFTARRW
ncbi:MAG TPA: acyl-CoA dehydrogenase family protein, partial [Thermoanaerobaculia bacterium]